MIFIPQSNCNSLYVNNVSDVTSKPQLEPQPDRSSLYINNSDVAQTAAVWTAAVCLGP